MYPSEWFSDHLKKREQQRILSAMSDSSRVYHDFGHAMDVGNACANLFIMAPGDGHRFINFYYFCAFYHDIVYVPGRKDNETRSGETFRHVYNRNVMGRQTYDGVIECIELTADHWSEAAYAAPQHMKNFIDADLLGLAADPARFDLNSAKVRLEFRDVSDEDYLAGRMKFFEHVIGQPKVFKNDWPELEKAARTNIIRELRNLESKTKMCSPPCYPDDCGCRGRYDRLEP